MGWSGYLKHEYFLPGLTYQKPIDSVRKNNQISPPDYRYSDTGKICPRSDSDIAHME